MRQIISDEWPQELARRLKRAGPRIRKRSDEKPYRVEQMPTGSENPPQAPDWWVELKFKDWLNAQKRKSQRFSQPERWEEKQKRAMRNEQSPAEWGPGTSKGNVEGHHTARPPLWGGGDLDEGEAAFPRSTTPADEVWATIRREQMEKLASVGITFEGTGDPTWAELEDAWDEYERRVHAPR